ncbi:HAMP domain-containing histidine kinase [Diaminobutyricibacter tongyongensis]|uniref:histidine kinase n=1 Tax=Leifsonia tongyongensis TaxID=1268043 RepID=A0A6L9XV92_9MICO|nr:HAMP domain-containing sensor histidine kinase [Diaminobutyricibacter tongyongensis]NEN05137.1 HAMP domain-containing histidine kinase [Diaminobutyricibacter tongyongensis]
MKRPRTLRWRLVAILAALLTVTSVVIGIVTVLSLQSYLLGQVDQNLSEASQRAVGAKNDLPPHGQPPGTTHGTGNGTGTGNTDTDGDHPFVGAPGQSPNTVVAVIVDGTYVVQGFTDSQGNQHELSTAVKTQLRAVPRDGEPHTVTLAGLGSYRVESTATDDGTVFITGLPLASLQATIDQLALVIGIVAIAGLLLAAGAGTVIVRRALRPLQHVAATASAVTELTLDRGEVPETMRVSEKDIEAGSEVGQVGTALNRLLGHVSNALVVREAAETKVRTFVADASHELRTPLATIRAYAELSQRTYDDASPALKRNVNRIESEAVRMTSLVEDLLLLARLDSEPESDVRQVDLSAMVTEAVMDAHLAGPDHTWHMQMSEDPVVLEADARQLRQVVVNLLANARVHTPPGTTVVTGLKRVGDTVELVVADDGPGIPADLQPTLFERFVRGDGSRSRTAGSTGLGLAIVRAVAEAHGGTVAVESAPGRTVFRVTLPA